MVKLSHIRCVGRSAVNYRHKKPDRNMLDPPPGFITRRQLQDKPKSPYGKPIDEQLKTNPWARAAFFGLDQPLEQRTDIGLPHVAPTKRDIRKHVLSAASTRARNPALQKAAHQRTLSVPLDTIRKDWLKSHSGQSQIVSVCDHYGIFHDLFGEEAYFYPVVPLDITYDVTGIQIQSDEIPQSSKNMKEETAAPKAVAAEEEEVARAHHGNILLPIETVRPPIVSFPSRPDLSWTLLLTSLDGHLTSDTSEYLHWAVVDIRGGVDSTEVTAEEGREAVPYLQPFPPRGTGFHRMVFLLFLHETDADLANELVDDLVKMPPDGHQGPHLPSRTFSTREFYRRHQEALTPAGLVFFQTTWDPSLTEFFHHTLRMREPSYEYDHEPAFLPAQKVYPHKEPFNVYLDKYADPKSLKRRILLKRLAAIDPFLAPGDTSKLRYPGAQPLPKEAPSWHKKELTKERFRHGLYKGLEDPFALDEDWQVTHFHPTFPDPEQVAEMYAVQKMWSPEGEGARRGSLGGDDREREGDNPVREAAYTVVE